MQIAAFDRPALPSPTSVGCHKGDMTRFAIANKGSCPLYGPHKKSKTPKAPKITGQSAHHTPPVEGQAAPQLQPANLRGLAQTGAAPTISGVFGEIVWLLTQSPVHRHFFVSDLEWYVIAPVTAQQFRLFKAEGRPAGLALWAYLDEAAEERLRAGGGRLSPEGWNGGEALWLIDMVAPWGGAAEMIKELSKTGLKGKKFKYYENDAQGGRTVKEIG